LNLSTSMGKKKSNKQAPDASTDSNSFGSLESQPQQAAMDESQKPIEVEMGKTKSKDKAERTRSPSRRRHSQQSQGEPEKPGMLALLMCFFGIMGSFILYGIVMEYATSEGRKLHELSLIFITSALYSVTAYIGRYVRAEQPTTVPREKLLILALTSMGSTFTSVRSLRYVIYPIQVLAKSCKPVPVMLMGALMGKTYHWKKYLNVTVIVIGVALFMQSPDKHKGGGETQLVGVILLFISLCFDGGTGAYEDKLMSKEHVGPFDLMFNIQFGKALVAALLLVIFGQINYFFDTVKDTGVILIVLGLTGAFGQVFIFVTISKFGALTCAIIGLARKIVTLVVSIVIYGHTVTYVQAFGLVLAISAMVMNFVDKKDKKKGKKSDVKEEIAEPQEKKGLLAAEDPDDEDADAVKAVPVDVEKGAAEVKAKKVTL